MENLYIPGPTTCPETVLQFQSKHTTLSQLKNNLLSPHRRRYEGLETALVNLFSPGDKFLSAIVKNKIGEETNGKKKR